MTHRTEISRLLRHEHGKTRLNMDSVYHEKMYSSQAHFSPLANSPTSAQERLSTAYTRGPSPQLALTSTFLNHRESPTSSLEQKIFNTMSNNTPSNIPPSPAYFPTSADSPLHPPTALYTKLQTVLEQEETSKLLKTQDFLIPPRSGKAWHVPAGSLFRLSTPQGPQVRNQSIHTIS